MNCRHCTATTTASESDARALGWRWYEGPSQTGKPISDVVCPECAGDFSRTLSRYEDDEPGWAVGCRTCGWEYDAEFDGDPLRTEREAMNEADDHRCEPETWTRAPNQWTAKAERLLRQIQTVAIPGGEL